MCFMKRASLIVVGCVAAEAGTCCITVQISYSSDRTIQDTEGRQKLMVDLGKQKNKDKTRPEQQESGHKVIPLDAAMHRCPIYKWG